MFPDVRILFPRETDAEKDVIHLVGKKEDVLKVKKQLEAMINELVKFVFDFHQHWSPSVHFWTGK